MGLGAPPPIAGVGCPPPLIGFGKFIFLQFDPVYPEVFYSTRFFSHTFFLIKKMRKTSNFQDFSILGMSNGGMNFECLPIEGY